MTKIPSLDKNSEYGILKKEREEEKESKGRGSWVAMMKALRIVVVARIVMCLGVCPLIVYGITASSAAYIVPHLVLISQTSERNWAGGFNTSESAATVLTWFANHGYPRLLTDLNKDGTINELDTTDLTNLLAKRMEADVKESSRDPRLVMELVRYVSKEYPREFNLEIYNINFLQEYQEILGKAFEVTDFPNIMIQLKDKDAPYPHYALGMLHVKKSDIPNLTEKENSSYFFTTSEPPVQSDPPKQNILTIAEDTCSVPTEEPTVFHVYTQITREDEYDWYAYEVENEDFYEDYCFSIDYIYAPNPDKLKITDLVIPSGWTGWVLMFPGLSGCLWETGFFEGIGGDEKVIFSFEVPGPTKPVACTVRVAGTRGPPCYCMEFAKYLKTIGPGS